MPEIRETSAVVPELFRQLTDTVVAAINAGFIGNEIDIHLGYSNSDVCIPSVGDMLNISVRAVHVSLCEGKLGLRFNVEYSAASGSTSATVDPRSGELTMNALMINEDLGRTGSEGLSLPTLPFADLEEIVFRAMEEIVIIGMNQIARAGYYRFGVEIPESVLAFLRTTVAQMYMYEMGYALEASRRPGSQRVAGFESDRQRVIRGIVVHGLNQFGRMGHFRYGLEIGDMVRVLLGTVVALEYLYEMYNAFKQSIDFDHA